MKRRLALGLVLGALLLASCSSGSPQAPVGFDKHPANSAATIATLTAVRAPASEALPPGQVQAARASPVAALASLPTPTASIMVISSFSAPGGVATLDADDRARLVAAAKEARVITLYCRTDRARPSRAGWRASVQRGVEVKRFLVAQGIKPAKVRLLARSAGAFIADNTTAVGRAKNRRVEIHFA